MRRIPALSVVASGKVKAEREVHLSFKVAGKIASVSAEVGKLVEKGEVLARLDTSKLWNDLQKSYADLNKTNSEYYQARDKLGEVRQTYKADPHSNEAKAALGQQQTAVDAQLFALEKARFQLKIAKNSLADTSLRSPIVGMVTEVNAKVGERLSAFDTEPLITISDFDTLYFEAEIEERSGGLIKLGQKAKIEFDFYPEKEFSGEVFELGKQIRTTKDGDRVFPVKIKIESKEFLPLELEGDAEIFL